MKKKIFGGLIVLAIAAVATFNLNLNSQHAKLPILSLTNIEALANEGSWSGDGSITIDDKKINFKAEYGYTWANGNRVYGQLSCIYSLGGTCTPSLTIGFRF